MDKTNLKSLKEKEMSQIVDGEWIRFLAKEVRGSESKMTDSLNNKYKLMKTVIFVMCSLLFFVGCTEKEEVMPEVIEPEIDFYNGFVGEKYFMFLDKDVHLYTVKNNNPEILSWEYSEKNNEVIDVNTLSSGYGTIDVLDAEGNIKFAIGIHSRYFGGDNIEELSMHPTERCEIVVEAQHADVKQAIESVLKENMDRINRTLYTFDAETKKFTMSIPKLEQKIQGTYEWSIDSLILRYNDVTERYSFRVAVGRVCYIIQDDKTKEYQLLYPDAGITLVRVKRIWYDHRMIIPGSGGLIL